MVGHPRPLSGELRSLAAFDTTTPAQAIRWIRTALQAIVPALHGPARTRAERWLTTGHIEAQRDLHPELAENFRKMLTRNANIIFIKD
ncbi:MULTISPECIES: hypothetical protein [Streptomyces]|uniref:hypothetical protein n=1 Tax=Streptomyces TaxID=1883 RepID=UPI002248ECE1|nr:hypothetical protein [Streptomyces sp. JHD 1]MCX2968183.1 hypothetical protein [Streptomyces sp. JHD 1]